jgi:TrmH family RNA methyltransferase
LLQISSLQNGRIKQLVKLSKRRERDQHRLTLVEGAREISHLLATGIVPREVYVCPALLDDETRILLSQLQNLAHDNPSTSPLGTAPARSTAVTPSVARYPAVTPVFFEVTAAVFEKIAYRVSGGLLLVISYVNQSLAELRLSDTPFLVIIEGVEKPGNLGAILRTADAAGVDAVIVCAGATDLHNPNVVRASLGALFTLPMVEVETAELLLWLALHKIQAVAADPAATVAYTMQDLTVPLAIVMGSEAYGLSPTWLTHADAMVKIPMRGAVDSLNLSAATAIVLYEALRQRMQATVNQNAPY